MKRGDAAGARLGRDYRDRAGRSVAARADHLRLDATALLALALYRLDDYRKSGLPMLPVTHGERPTRLHILLYTVVLIATTALPFVIQMSGGSTSSRPRARRHLPLVRMAPCSVPTAIALARSTFNYSIVYLPRCSRRCWSITT